MNPQTIPAGSNFTAMTVEVWFKSDAMSTGVNEIIVGMTPYKIRQKSSSNALQISYNSLLTYCDTNSTLVANTWY